jgi:hypothetical protein
MKISKDISAIQFQADTKILCEICRSKSGKIELRNPMNMMKSFKKNSVERLWMVVNKDEKCVI